MTDKMTFPNMYCGECPYWLAYNEPDTSAEENKKIEKICSNCVTAHNQVGGKNK